LRCNKSKGPHLAGLDPHTGKLTPPPVRSGHSGCWPKLVTISSPRCAGGMCTNSASPALTCRVACSGLLPIPWRPLSPRPQGRELSPVTRPARVDLLVSYASASNRLSRNSRNRSTSV
jgi:hypothetical protein